MLVISRKSGQGLTIGNSVHVRVLEINSGTVKIGLEAPDDVSVYRDELYENVADINRLAAKRSGKSSSDR